MPPTKLAFIGRKEELNELHRQTKKNIASLIVVKGRRRIGKSRLVEEFAKSYSFYEFSGLVPTEKTTKQTQLNEFSTQFGLAFNIPSPLVEDWNNIFFLLAKHTKKGRVIILLDEISWMGSE